MYVLFYRCTLKNDFYRQICRFSVKSINLSQIFIFIGVSLVLANQQYVGMLAKVHIQVRVVHNFHLSWSAQFHSSTETLRKPSFQ